MTDAAERFQRHLNDTLVALAFFSRIPVEAPQAVLDVRRAAAGWPLAGLILAAGPGAAIVVCTWLGLPLLVSALLALACGMLLTGAFHEDGLADTFDGAAHGRTAEQRLAIMRDSRLGTFGALALGIVIAVKAAAIAALAASPPKAVLALLVVAILSRVAALWHWSATNPARRDGMAVAAGKPEASAVQPALVAAIVAAIVMVAGFGGAAFLAVALAAAATVLLSATVDRRLGGHTGDTIGAAQQIAEALLLAGLSSVSTTILV